MAETSFRITNKTNATAYDIHLEFKSDNEGSNSKTKILGLDGVSPTSPDAHFSVDGEEYDNPKSITNIKVDNGKSIDIRVQNKGKNLPEIDAMKSYWTDNRGQPVNNNNLSETGTIEPVPPYDPDEKTETKKTKQTMPKEKKPAKKAKSLKKVSSKRKLSKNI